MVWVNGCDRRRAAFDPRLWSAGLIAALLATLVAAAPNVEAGPAAARWPAPRRAAARQPDANGPRDELTTNDAGARAERSRAMRAAELERAALVADQPLVVRWVIGVWMGVVGLVFGSFLNVIVYRVPLGRSISFPPSACPRCGCRIRWYDNLPVISWWCLGGKCRNCEMPIARRYPLVEFTCGAVWFALAVAEFVWHGWNLPLAGHPSTVYRQVFWTDEVLLANWALHAALLYTLFGAALMDWDGHARTSIFLPLLALGLLVSTFMTHLHTKPVPMEWVPSLGGRTSFITDYFVAAENALLSVLVATVVWWLPKRWGLARKNDEITSARRVVAVAVFTMGIVLGWLPALLLLIVSIGCAAAHQSFWLLEKRKATSLLGWLTALTLVWIFLWKPIVAFVPWLGFHH